MNKVLLDTNFIIYALDEDSDFHSWTQKILSNPDYQFFTTSKNLSEFISVVTKPSLNLLSVAQTTNTIQEISEFCEILYPDPHTYNYFVSLLNKYSFTGSHIHDLEIASIAITNNIEFIATANVKDFTEVSEIKLISP